MIYTQGLTTTQKRNIAIRNTHATVVTIYSDGDSLDTNGGVVSLDESAITTEINRLQAEYDVQAYARSRKTEYPDIGDQLDDLFHKGVFSTEMAATLQAVKDKYPKE